VTLPFASAAPHLTSPHPLHHLTSSRPYVFLQCSCRSAQHMLQLCLQCSLALCLGRSCLSLRLALVPRARPSCSSLVLVPRARLSHLSCLASRTVNRYGRCCAMPIISTRLVIPQVSKHVLNKQKKMNWRGRVVALSSKKRRDAPLTKWLCGVKNFFTASLRAPSPASLEAKTTRSSCRRRCAARSPPPSLRHALDHLGGGSGPPQEDDHLPGGGV
jgi:hypothetical protein